MDLKRIVFVLFRYKLAIAVFVFASMFASAGLVSLVPDSYEASALILVKAGREISAPAQDILDGGGFVTQKRKEDIYAEVEILESDHVLERVVNEIGADIVLNGLEPDDAEEEPEQSETSVLGSALAFILGLLPEDDGPKLTPEQEAVAALGNAVAIEAVLRSDTIRLRYSNEEPELALLVVETLLAKFLERHIEVHKGGHMDVVFQPQVDHYAAELARLEDSINTLEVEQNVFALESQRSELIHQKVAARADLEETRRGTETKRRKVARIETQLAEDDGFSPMQDTDPGLDAVRTRLLELELKREELMASARARDIDGVTAEIARAKQLLKEEQRRLLYASKMDLVDLGLREKALAADIEAYQETLRVIDGVDTKRRKLERERAITEQNYLLYVNELEQARISAAMDLARITNVRVLQPAAVAGEPSSPSIVLVGLIALVLSGVLGVAAVFLLDYLDHSIKNARDVEVHLGLPVLGSIAEQGGQ